MKKKSLLNFFVLLILFSCQAFARDNKNSYQQNNNVEKMFEAKVLSNFSLFLVNTDQSEAYSIRLIKPLNELEIRNFTNRQFIIIGDTRKIGLLDADSGLEISVNGYEEFTLPKSFKVEFKLTVDGISHLIGKEWVTNNMKINPYVGIYSVDGDNSGVSCGSGGVGSTQCSVKAEIAGISQECSVTCGQGYYACCQPLQGTCKCVKN